MLTAYPVRARTPTRPLAHLQKPSAWKAQRGTTVTDEEIASHKAQATLHDMRYRSTLDSKLGRMATQGDAQAKERLEYNKLDFIGRKSLSYAWL